MKTPMMKVQSAPASTRRARRALVECGLWLRVGFVGASGVAAGLLQLFSSDVAPLSALALAVGGAMLAAFSWWRGRAVLDFVDEGIATTGQVPSPAGAGAAASP